MKAPNPVERADSVPGPDFLTLKEFFSVFAKVITALVGFGALYLLFGYTIILSFISTVRLYGITSFTSDYYKEATINFISNMLGTYADHLSFTLLVIASLTITFAIFKKYGGRLEKYSKLFEVVLMAIAVGIILCTLRLGYFYDDFYIIHHARELFLFDISVPFLIILFYYLGVNFRKFYKEPYTVYYIFCLLAAILYLGIPVSYGDNIFDIVLYPVVGLDPDSEKSVAIKKLSDSINGQGSIPLFYFMGYSTDKIILFDNQTLSPPAKVVILSKESVKYINISNNFKNKLRNMVRNQKYHRIDPVPQPNHKVSFEIMSGNALKTREATVKIPDPSLTVIKPGRGIGEIELGDSIRSTVTKMKISPNLARKILYQDGVEYWLNYEDLGLALIFGSDKRLSKIAINNPSMILDNHKIGVRSPLSELSQSFGPGKEVKHEQGYKQISYPTEGVSFTVDPQEGKVFTINIFKKAPLPPGPQPLSGKASHQL